MKNYQFNKLKMKLYVKDTKLLTRHMFSEPVGQH